MVSHTAHSVSRRGLRRRDLSDVELRDLLSDLLSCVRISHILPPDSEVLVSAVRRGLISTPPSYMLGDDLCVGHSSNIKPKAWIRGRNSHGLYVKPRLFTPFVEEAKVIFLSLMYCIMFVLFCIEIRHSLIVSCISPYESHMETFLLKPFTWYYFHLSIFLQHLHQII